MTKHCDIQIGTSCQRQPMQSANDKAEHFRSVSFSETHQQSKLESSADLSQYKMISTACLFDETWKSTVKDTCNKCQSYSASDRLIGICIRRKTRSYKLADSCSTKCCKHALSTERMTNEASRCRHHRKAVQIMTSLHRLRPGAHLQAATQGQQAVPPLKSATTRLYPIAAHQKQMATLSATTGRHTQVGMNIQDAQQGHYTAHSQKMRSTKIFPLASLQRPKSSRSRKTTIRLRCQQRTPSIRRLSLLQSGATAITTLASGTVREQRI